MEETLECSDDKFLEMMGSNESDESESINEAFICCVCRDLLYKPVILACGHISCFWCIHKSMSGLQKSRCPICRSPYYHFPYVCQMLHLLLLKLYPGFYRRRESQTLEEEKEIGYFSPQVDGSSCQLHLKSLIRQRCSKPDTECAQIASESIAGQPAPVAHGFDLENVPVHEEVTCAANVTSDRDRNSSQTNDEDTSEQVSVNDLICSSCKEMLFRPAVLNCGHVLCIYCIVPLKDGVLLCEACQSPHPGAIPKVCLELDHFLEHTFPREYGLRRDKLQIKQEQYLNEIRSTCSSETKKEERHFSNVAGGDPLPWWHVDSKVHVGIGCDACGMFPIIGDRYRCKDCVEEIGFDLCQDCYTTRSKLPGRFNQQHTSEHKFEMVKSNAVRDIMLSLLRERFQEVSGGDAVLPSHTADEDMEGGAVSPLPSSEADTN